MTTPNTALRAVRAAMLLSQDDFAKELQAASEKLGRTVHANKRLVQRWESGAVTVPRADYARALEVVTGMPIESLGFASPSGRVTPDGAGGHDVQGSSVNAPTVPRGEGVARGPFSGVWLSRYEYFSSGRDSSFVGLHYVLLLQHGNRLTVRSLPGSSKSSMTMDLTVDRNVLTGSWVEQTHQDSYYKGARYHGAIQMLAEPTARRIAGKWLGFGKDMEINSGPWELIFQDASTGRATIEQYNRRPE